MPTAEIDEQVHADHVRDTRAIILGAARRTFLRKGFHRATVDDITRSAKLAHGTFYRYFRNKQEVLHGLMADTISSLTLPKRDPGGEDMFTAVRTDLGAYFSHFWEHRDLAVVWMEAAGHDEKVALARDRLRRPFLERIEKSIRWAIAEGDIPPIDVTVATRALATLGEHFALDWLGPETDGTDLDDCAHTVALVWCRGLGYSVSD